MCNTFGKDSVGFYQNTMASSKRKTNAKKTTKGQKGHKGQKGGVGLMIRPTSTNWVNALLFNSLSMKRTRGRSNKKAGLSVCSCGPQLFGFPMCSCRRLR